jgi:hypothetical protein
MAGVPPQFLKNAAAKKPAAAPSGNPFAGNTDPGSNPFAKKGDSAPLFAKKKKARGSAIENMQKQDAMLDAKLGPNDAPDAPMKMPMKGMK